MAVGNLNSGPDVQFFPTRKHLALLILVCIVLSGMPLVLFVLLPDNLSHIRWTLPLCSISYVCLFLPRCVSLLYRRFAIRVDEVGVTSNTADWFGQLHWHEIESVRIVDTANWGPLLEIFVVDRTSVLQRFGWFFRKTWKYDKSGNTPFSTPLNFVNAPKEVVLSAIEAGLNESRIGRRGSTTQEDER